MIGGAWCAADHLPNCPPAPHVTADRDNPVPVEEVQDAGPLDQPHSG
jgi:hypothetical protein